MTDETKAVAIVTGAAKETTDTTVDTAKTYYKPSGVGFIKVVPEEEANPKTSGWVEIG